MSYIICPFSTRENFRVKEVWYLYPVPCPIGYALIVILYASDIYIESVACLFGRLRKFSVLFDTPPIRVSRYLAFDTMLR